MSEENKLHSVDEASRANALEMTKSTRVRRFLRRFGKISLISLLVLAICGFAWDQIATQIFLAKNPPPGEIVRLNDVDFHVLVRGERQAGEPVLVIEPGLGDGVLEWLHLVDECEAFTQVVVTDRRGQGFSSGLSSGSRTPRQNMEDLRSILLAKGVEPPYVLAGHSMGGLNARVFQSMYPDSVVGLVLIDALTYDHLDPDEIPRVPLYAYPFTLSGRVGVIRLLGFRGDDISRLPEANLETILGQRSMGTYVTNLLHQYQGLVDGHYETKELLASDRDVPLTVISAKGVGDPKIRWKEGQKVLQNLSPTAKSINLNCHHSVHLVNRELVISELRSMMALVRLHAKTTGTIDQR